MNFGIIIWHHVAIEKSEIGNRSHFLSTYTPLN